MKELNPRFMFRTYTLRKQRWGSNFKTSYAKAKIPKVLA